MMVGKQVDMLLLNRPLNLLSAFFFLALLSSCASDGPVEKQTKMDDALKKRIETKGKMIVEQSAAALSNELKTAIATKGLDSALHVCNHRAMPIIDSLTQQHNASIQRLAIRVRNQKNKPNKEQRHILKLMERAKYAGEKLRPMAFLKDSITANYYHPILAQPLCLNCHGDPGVSMQEGIYEQITQLYPTDKAIGYKLDDLRGMWALEFSIQD